MTEHERIEEAHGLWELAVQRLAAMVEIGATVKLGHEAAKLIREAAKDERLAHAHWRLVSNEITGATDRKASR